MSRKMVVNYTVNDGTEKGKLQEIRLDVDSSLYCVSECKIITTDTTI